MNGDERVAGAAQCTGDVPAPAETGIATVSRPAVQLYSQAEAAREQSRLLAARLRAAHQATAETFQLIYATWDRAGEIRAVRSAAGTRSLRYSVTARLQARLASMPVIEQAKGIVMAESGLPADQAFDVLRRASQRENIKMRELAARIVAQAEHTAAVAPKASRAPAAAPAAEVVTHTQIVSNIAGAAARQHADQATG